MRVSAKVTFPIHGFSSYLLSFLIIFKLLYPLENLTYFFFSSYFYIYILALPFSEKAITIIEMEPRTHVSPLS